MGANAVTTFPTYTTGQVLEAADLNITNCGVPVFAGTTERDAAFGGTGEKTLAEGQLCYLESTNIVQYYDGSSWATVGPTVAGVLQVVGTSKTDSFTTTSTSYTDLTGMSVTITPTSATSKVLVGYFVQASGVAGTNMGGIQVVRDSTNILVSTTAGSRSNASSIIPELGTPTAGQVANVHLDSPATTSAITYKLQIRTGAAGTIVVNRTNQDVDNTVYFRSCSTMYAMEVSA